MAYDNLRCDECGGRHDFDTSLPSDVWNKICGSDSVLCLTCIDRRLYAMNMECEAEFYFVGKALKSKAYSESQGHVEAARRDGIEEAASMVQATMGGPMADDLAAKIRDLAFPTPKES